MTGGTWVDSPSVLREVSNIQRNGTTKANDPRMSTIWLTSGTTATERLVATLIKLLL
jgi:hypothetical protein